MGDLVVMPRPQAPLASRAIAAGASAEILFFTGVRYFRMEEATPSPILVKRRRSPAARKNAAARRAERLA